MLFRSVSCVERERKLIDLGVNSYVYKDDIEDFITTVENKIVKVIEIERYPREIPNEIVDVISETKDIFDRMYIVFTDYTDRVGRSISAERKEKDPILFGTFKTNEKEVYNRSINDKFYYLGDWEDEYCDLTMDKFLRQAGEDKLKELKTPVNEDELMEELNKLNDDLTLKSSKQLSDTTSKKGFFSNIKTSLKRKLNVR